MKPFLFARGIHHYARFFIPTAYRALSKNQKYLVFSLGVGEGHIIRKKASIIENQLVAKIQQLEIDMNFDDDGTGIDWTRVRKFEVNLEKGILKADGPEDHARLVEALNLMKDLTTLQNSIKKQSPLLNSQKPTSTISSTNSLTLLELLDKYFLLKKLKPATVSAHKLTIDEFTKFLKSKTYIADILKSDVARYKEYLAGVKKNTPRTIDGKIGYLKTVLNFGIAQGYLLGKNPAEGSNLLTKRQKLTEGYSIFELEEIKNIYTSEYFNKQKIDDPDYYYILLFEIFTGCRISELTSLSVAQLKKSENDNYFLQIRDAKTSAGKREIPIPAEIITEEFKNFLKNKKGYDQIFRYVFRDGKGSGNAVGKKFSRHLEVLKIERDKLVFHSIRKFLNDYFLKHGVEFEARCQFFGHEIESVNVATYSKKF